MKIPLGLWEGSTENATVATALLSDLVDRGLDVEQGVLCVLDGAKALRKAVRDVLGVHTPVQRCVRHKERNVLEHLPERDRPAVKRRLRRAWAAPTTSGRSTRCASSPPSSTAPTPARRPRSGRAWRRRSPSPASASAAAQAHAGERPTRASR